jgi:Bifunctional DNA primase/polymerase, N-terminal/Protein of unknown function (DUF3987)
MGAFQQLSARLIERGYAPLPIMPGTKAPGVLSNGRWVGLPRWQTRYNGRSPSETELAHWGEGNTGVGVLGGYGGLAPIDIDTNNTTVRAALDAVLPGTTVRKIGKRGETLFYYAPHVKASRRWLIDGEVICELIGPGRQTVLPPTVHPDTRAPYYWSGADTLENVAPHELPLLPDDILARIAAALLPFGHEDEQPLPASVIEDTPHRTLNDAAMGNLAAWVPVLPLYRLRAARGGYEAVPIWRPSSTGRSDDARDLNLKIHPKGIRDFGADKGYTPLDLVMVALGCDLDHAFGFLAERLGWSDATIRITLQAEAEPVPELADPEPLLQYATGVPGVVGDIIEYVIATARRPNPVLALATAVTVVGTLIGRRVAGPTDSATHLYAVAIGGTGAGKQHILDSAMRLLRAAKAGDHIGPSKFFSGTAVIDLLEYKPLCLCPQDEIGVFLKAVTNRRASSHEAAVSQTLRSAWGTSFADLNTPAWATKRMSLISCPAVSILGVSTPDEFYSALQGDSVKNGLVNRFLVLQSNVQARDTNPTITGVPGGLQEALSALYLWSGPESLLQINNPSVTYRPDVLPWASDQAAKCYADFGEHVRAYVADNPRDEPYLARVAENAVRLATIRAAGRWGHGAKVDMSDMEWSAGLAWATAQATVDAIVSQVPETERGVFAEKLLEIIRRRGSVTARDIQMSIRGRLRSMEIKDIIRQLIEGGEVECSADGQYRAVR